MKFSSTNLRSLAQRTIFVLGIVILFAASPKQLYATHISGADLTYTWISGNTFELELTLYRDCSGITAPNNVSINYRSVNCGYNLNVTLDKKPGTGQEITQPCNSSATTCTGGTSPGIQKYEYIGNVTLPAQCTDWVFGYAICCRNCAITTLTFSPPNCSGAPATYIEATLNNLNAPRNSSPLFSNLPVAFFCIGQPFHYNHGAFDIDGDSIVYSFIPPRSAAGTNVVFTPPYSATNPISSSPPLTLSPTGDIVLNPTSIEVGVMAILVREYRNGVLIGSVVRDMQVYTQACSNLLPTASGINGTNNYTIAACPGVPLSFNIFSADGNSNQNVSMDWNWGIAGATLNTTGGSRPVGTFNWTPTLAEARSTPYTFTVTVIDDNCPSYGSQTYSYSIIVPPLSATASSMPVQCAGSASGSASVVANGTGPYQYLWTPGNQTTSSITGIMSGSYSVRVTDLYGCTVTSGSTVGSPTSVSGTILSTTDVRCNGGSSGSATVGASGGTAPYTYTWSPSGGTLATATGLSAGGYMVTVRDSRNCTQTINLNIAEPPPINPLTTATSSTCGNSNGSASISVSGGTEPYRYSWNPGGATGSTISNISAGTYQVNILDAQNCVANAQVLVSNINGPTSTLSSINHVTCYGGSNGSATITVNNGTAPFTYLWSNAGSTTSTINNLSAGNYSVQIRDANNCIHSSPFTITQPQPLTSSGSSMPISCFGGNDGQTSVFASGGTPPYTYTWLPGGATTATINGISSGTYTARVTDQYGCSTLCTNAVASASALSASIFSTTAVKCHNGNDGTASVSVSGGTPPYTYLWQPYGGTNSTATSLDTGLYQVTIRDANNCNQVLNININQPTELTLGYSTQPAGCGLSNGSASVNVSGGVSPYTYSWSSGTSTTSTLSNISAGSYQVSVRDANNCLINSSVAVSNSSGPSAAVSSISHVLCNGGNNGSAAVNVSGGTAPFTYQWSHTSGSSATASNLLAGNYSVTITDANNCATGLQLSVLQPTALNLQISSINNLCSGGNSGQVSANVSGGTAPYIYNWQAGVSTNSIMSGLADGTYSVLVTDQHGCTSLSSGTISSPASIIGTVLSSSDVSCYGGSDGSATITASGGTSPYTYLWTSIGINSSTATGLSAGSYSVQITDANGCIGTCSVIINQPSALNLTPSSVPSTCSLSNGMASVTVSGGTTPYTYSWNPGGVSISNLSNIPSGVYRVSVYDANNCSLTDTIIVSNASGPSASISSVRNVSCFGGSDGSATVTSSGGTAPITYIWSHNSINAPTVSGLSAGNYTVLVRDANNCEVTLNINITQAPALSVLGFGTPVSCFGGSDGQISVVTSGGTPPYAYNWTGTGPGSSHVSNLAAGSYNLIVTDANSCTSNTNYTVGSPAALLGSILSSSMVSCYGGNDGTAKISVAGGISPYHYSWSPYGGSGDSAHNLDTGIYTITIHDANNCEETLSVNISQPPPLGISNTSTPAGCGLSNGSATVNVSGGTRPLDYVWSTGASGSATLNNISSGSYQVIVTDAKNCTISSSVAVSNTSGPNANISSLDPVSCKGGNDGQATVAVSNGVPPFTYQWSSSGSSGAGVSNLSAGNYSVTIRDSNNCVTALSFTVNEPPALIAHSTSSPATCYGKNDGTASLNISGGTAPYSYQWSNGQTGQNLTQLLSGTYSSTITDYNGCITTSSVTITQPNALILRTISTPVSCYNGTDGQGIAQCSGGTPGYTYNWSNGSTSNQANGLSAGNYSVIVTDAHGCSETNLTSISEPLDLSITATEQDVSCYGGNNGYATINVSGGTAPYGYSWPVTGGIDSTAANLSAGSYVVEIRDLRGCSKQHTIQINQPTEIETIINSTDVSCFGGSDGSANVICTGGIPPYSYTWNDGHSGATINQVGAGLYTVSISDQNGCMKSNSVFIREPSPLRLQISPDPTICIGQSTQISAQGAGGIAPYTYHWSNGVYSQTQYVNPMQSAYYIVRVTDDRGCSSKSDSIYVLVKPALIAILTGTDSICEGGTATLSANAVGGNGEPYNYIWSTGETQSIISVQPEVTSNYTVTVNDNCGTPPQHAIHAVVVNPNPDPLFIPVPVSGCVPLTVPFSMSMSNQSIVSHQWNFGDGNTSLESKPQHTYFKPGDYTVSHHVTDSRNCSSSVVFPQAVRVYSLPVADFYTNPDVASLQEPNISFSDASSETVKYVWDFGDESPESYLKDPQHTYKDTGTYIVRLISESIHGCVDTTYKPVRVKGEFAIFIPNAFTPNGDGINESFFPLTISAKEIEMTILDRWGLEIFHSSDEIQAWNGKKDGSEKPCQMDVYLYIILAKDMDDRQYRYTGRVSLIR